MQEEVIMFGDGLQVTSIDALKSYKVGVIVKLPDFDDGLSLVARLRMPSMMSLVKRGKIPNALLVSANGLFDKSKPSKADPGNQLGDMYDLCYAMADACLVEPTLKQIEDAGLELTDKQLVAIFNYSQRGVSALDPFREEQSDNIDVSDSEVVLSETE